MVERISPAFAAEAPATSSRASSLFIGLGVGGLRLGLPMVVLYAFLFRSMRGLSLDKVILPAPTQLPKQVVAQ